MGIRVVGASAAAGAGVPVAGVAVGAAASAGIGRVGGNCRVGDRWFRSGHHVGEDGPAQIRALEDGAVDDAARDLPPPGGVGAERRGRAGIALQVTSRQDQRGVAGGRDPTVGIDHPLAFSEQRRDDGVLDRALDQGPVGRARRVGGARRVRSVRPTPRRSCVGGRVGRLGRRCGLDLIGQHGRRPGADADRARLACLGRFQRPERGAGEAVGVAELEMEVA